MDVQVQLARYRLGLLRGEDLPDVALRLLELGLDSQAVRELAALDRPTLRDTAELFERALRETGQVVSPEDSANRLVAAAVLRDIVAGAIDPYRGAVELWRLWTELGYPDDLTVFVSLEDDYADHPEWRPRLAEEIIEAARGRLAAYPLSVA